MASPWIIGPRADSLLILGAPALCVAGVWAAAMAWSPQAIWLVVMSFGALGHHLPGFIRTYGDRALFRRHQRRFVLAPIVVLGSALALAHHDLHGLLLITMVWSIWHGMMQHYGFMRIYDAKRGVVDSRTAWLDWLITVAWFGLCLTLSPHQTGSLLDGLYEAGFSLVPPAALDGLKLAMIPFTAGVTLVYIHDHWRRRGTARASSGLKLTLLVTTTALVYYARVLSSDPFLSVALFEVLHDVQYLAIVWAFNRRALARDSSSAGPLSRCLFRPGIGALLAYIGLCLAYGGLGVATSEWLPGTQLETFAVAALTSSAILHYYYDGFIWKLREADTQRGLDIAGADAHGGQSWRRDLLHLALFVAPILGLALLESRSPASRGAAPTQREQAESIVATAPDSATARRNLASALIAEGRQADALPHLRAAVELTPDDAGAREQLGRALLELGQIDGAREQLREASRLAPERGEVRRALAQASLAARDLPGAIEHYRAAIARGVEGASIRNDLGYALLNVGALDDALRELQLARSLDPEHAGVCLNLGLVYGSMRDPQRAAEHFERALALDPTFVDAHNNLGGALMMMGRRDEARASFERALALDPTFEPARHNLQRLDRR